MRIFEKKEQANRQHSKFNQAVNQIRTVNIIITLIFVFAVQKALAFNHPKSQNKVDISGYLYLNPHNYQGSPYLNDSWMLGTIFLENGDEVNNIRLKYNRLTGELVFYHENLKQLFAVDPLILNSFVLNSEETDSLLFTKFTGNDIGVKLRNGDFINYLFKGGHNFFVKRSASIIEAKEVDTKDKIVLQDEYFLQTDTQVNEIKLTLKSLISNFPNRKQELKKLARKNHFRRKNENDMLKMILFLDK